MHTGPIYFNFIYFEFKNPQKNDGIRCYGYPRLMSSSIGLNKLK
jgi:hypothetical protein